MKRIALTVILAAIACGTSAQEREWTEMDAMGQYLKFQLFCLRDPDWRGIVEYLEDKGLAVHVEKSIRANQGFDNCYRMEPTWIVDGLNVVEICGNTEPYSKYKTQFMNVVVDNKYEDIKTWLDRYVVGDPAVRHVWYEDLEAIHCYPRG